ncbi:hypothetical protein [Clostridium estertheticum]|uniref:Uncharacterized protein n=1 Tax=Clostridium estertheticum subsp. estertheticum TaxID=1552 RepID=A0A1J0GFJ7_9CLOT|nr:hypothetical protein [Clostridium estertheticum]APC40075.1 hypothetical protein A7L45_08325 [Clostridium estertheticum subsp. estertheticum]MBZ9618149.1 hypothetical protein [Clostridium estertheticum subsp. laramiense]WAG73799.1 hypothetical protein LL032_22225 [Clostridium estertheticum]
MNHIISMILFVLFGILILIEYFKDKKTYRLITIIPILFAIFFQQQSSNSISNPLLNILIGILTFIGFFIFYLILKDKK